MVHTFLMCDKHWRSVVMIERICRNPRSKQHDNAESSPVKSSGAVPD